MKTQGRVTNAGFVPVELLAIICVLLLAAGVLLPSISRVKSKSASLICMNNHRQIVQAWQLYAQDNSGKTANNYTIPELLNSITPNGTIAGPTTLFLGPSLPIFPRRISPPNIAFFAPMQATTTLSTAVLLTTSSPRLNNSVVLDRALEAFP